MTRASETHAFRFIKPRPDARDLKEMVRNHFDLEAEGYDAFDAGSEKRRLYTSAIDRRIAESLPASTRVLSIACGTGRRDLSIRRLAGQRYEILGVELSPEMARIARGNGIVCETGDWLEATVRGPFDAAMCLYAFCAIPDSAQRLEALRKIRGALRPGAPLYLDVHDVDDATEWGPRIREEYRRSGLSEAGYELGDVLYSKVGDDRLAYWHYFSREEIESLLGRAGFTGVDISYVGYGWRPGEAVGRGEGAMFIRATF